LILDLPEDNVIDLENAPAGVCLIWHMSYAEGLMGLEPQNFVADLVGEFSLSNSIAITREVANGGELTGGPFSFNSVADGEPDMLEAGSVSLENNEGENSQWIITDDQGIILGLPPMPSAVDFDGAGPGTCLIWHLSYNSELEGLEVGQSANDIEGNCFDLSNSIQVFRTVEGDCQANGGELFGGPFEINSASDGQPDMPEAGSITLANSQGENSQWIVTDNQGIILGLPPMPSAVDFDGAGPGTCLIWHLSYEGEIQGLETGFSANDLEGECYALSNSIEVIRTVDGDCQANGGELIGGPFEISSASDGEPDMLEEGSITLANSQGENSQWIVTDSQGIILGLPPMPSAVDFDGAGAGTCLIWHLSYDGEIQGLETGLSANDLAGECFALSNSVEVLRTLEGDCQANGGELIGGPFEFNTIGDGEPDMLEAGSITLANSQGENSQWIVTDDQGTILGLPGMPSDVDFEGAGPGLCLIWHLSYDGEIEGLAVDMNANDLSGDCFSLSNSVEVNRIEFFDCDVVGGELEGGPFEITTAGDGEPDMLEAGSITLVNNQGENSQWIVTDDEGYILGLPPMPSAVDFDGAGPGTCLIWHLSYDGDIEGLETGLNANDLEGDCYDLSNSISVVRTVAGDCQVNGGEIFGGPFVFCVEDGIADMIEPGSITLANSQGSNSQWVVTDEEGNILGLPGMPSDVNFDDAGVGVCLIWHLSFEDGLMGAEEGMNANDLVGCFSLSNPISVERTIPAGGTISTEDELNVCTGDGTPDILTFQVEGNEGMNSTWVVTDEDANILAIPGTNEIDFETTPSGVCLVWHLSWNTLEGAEVGNNAADLTGCFELSNSIAVTRTQVLGGTISTDDVLQTCPGDGEDDLVDVVVEGAVGSNMAWVITDANGIILDLPDSPPFNFEEAGEGVCLIWHLSFEDGLIGAETGLNANDLEGCFSLSNALTVERITPVGGDISTEDPTDICAGDGIPDSITATIEGNQGANSQWIITDDLGTILALPESNTVDLEGAGEGICLIWHISYSTVEGLEVGNNANDLSGCFDLSNSITVDRTGVAGGTISTEDPTVICAGDGEGDPIDVTLEGNVGANSQWVITDEDGTILGLPPAPPFDLDEAGAGICLIWHLSFEDGIMGAEEGMNANDLQGCFSLSNPITVTRYQPEGGTISTDSPLEVCAGDGEDDVIVASVEGEVGPNFQWVVTDEAGEILGLPESNEVNLEGAGSGICLIWHLSFSEIEGAEIGMNANDLSGCFSLSNSIAINRIGVDAGVVSTDQDETEITIIVNDGQPDLVTFQNTSTEPGAEYIYVITDDSGIILGTPAESNDFEGVEAGTCRVYGVSYTGTLSADVGTNINSVSSDECYDVSEEWLIVNREIVDNVAINELSDLVIFPAIANDIVTLDTPVDVKVSITDLSGRIIFETNATQGSNTIDVTTLANGHYVMVVISNDAMESKRFVVNR
ncbi:MAG: T9SS type A sorting domain-containing protein, partial [Bacteroidota bacterium]